MSGPIKEIAAEIRSFLSGLDEMLVVTHFFPDGDAIGSLTAFGGMLDQLGVPHVLAVDDAPPEKYSFLPGYNRIVNLKQRPPDRVFKRVAVLDAGAISRIGAGDKGIGPETRILNIDHHFTGKYYGHVNLVDVNAAATAQILFELCLEWGLEITPQIGYGLYVGIITDTGRFRFVNTSARSVEVCAALIAKGVDSGWVTENVFYNMSLEVVRALTNALASLEMHYGGRLALIGLDHDRHVEDTEGFVEYAASIKGVSMAAFYSEMEPNVFKVSLRSRTNLDVSEVAGRFGGGGHRKAAGFRFRGKLSNLKERLLYELRGILESDLINKMDESGVQVRVPWLSVKGAEG
jgi:bifunctional oligoribonuclease and PAP phosphatase NrnA